MESKFLRNLQIGFSISFILLIISSTASFMSIKKFRDNQTRVEQTLEFLNTLNNINVNLKDKIIGIRGKLLSKDNKYSKTYYASIIPGDSLLSTLDVLVTNNPVQIRNAKELSIACRKYFVITQNIMSQIDNGNTVSYSIMETGREQTEVIQSIINKMKNMEHLLLKKRNEVSAQSAGTTPILLVVTSLLSLLITLIFYFRIRTDFKQRDELKNQLLQKDKDTTESILKIAEIAHQISLGDFSTRVDADDFGLLSKISNSLNSMAESLEVSFGKLNDEEWLQKGIASLNKKLLGNKTVNQICEESLSELIFYGQCEVGGLYVFEDGKITLKSFYNKEAFMKTSFNEGEGLIGQVFKDGVLKNIGDLGPDYFITTASGKIKLNHLLLIPIINANLTIGIIELGCSSKFTEVDILYHQTCGVSIGAALVSAKFRRNIQNLLEETQTQTEELQAQHSELENLN
ncbi:MAG: CHASE3 domain-containing protein, partial [Oligoflexus sp.]|nr:CHASE3 domain-containing protein [Pseudopedobacter sp.]